MERLTKQADGTYTADCDRSQLIARLGKFEDLYEGVTTQQAALPAQLEALRAAGKTRTYTFRELMSRKLNNTYVLSLFSTHNLP